MNIICFSGTDFYLCILEYSMASHENWKDLLLQILVLSASNRHALFKTIVLRTLLKNYALIIGKIRQIFHVQSGFLTLSEYPHYLMLLHFASLHSSFLEGNLQLHHPISIKFNRKIEFLKVLPAQPFYENKWLKEDKLMKGTIHQHSSEKLASHLVNHQLDGSTQTTNKHKHVKEPKTCI